MAESISQEILVEGKSQEILNKSIYQEILGESTNRHYKSRWERVIYDKTTLWVCISLMCLSRPILSVHA